MKDFAGSRTTYYSLAREKLLEKHQGILNVLLALALISMAGFAAFLLSDIISFGSNSDHQTFLAGLEGQNSIDNIMSIIDWNRKGVIPAVTKNPVEQRRRFDNPLESNTSPGSGAIVRMVANKSGDGNSSPSRAVYKGQNAKEQNLSNSSRTASNQPSSGSPFVSTGNTSSSKLVNEKKAHVIKMNHGSSSGTPISQPQKQKPQANAIKVNTTQANTTRVNATQVNATKAGAALVSNIQTNNSSTNPLQKEAISSTRSPVYSISLSQLQADPTSVEASPIGQSQTRAAEIDSAQPNSALNAPEANAGKPREDPVLEQSANAGKENGIDLSEKENRNTPSEISPANPEITNIALAQNSADNAALPKDVADTSTDPTKDTPAEKPPRVIEFKTDSTTSPGSENSPGDGNTNSGTVSNTNPASGPITPESSPNAENKETQPNISPISTDSTSNSKSPAAEGGSASIKKPDTTESSKAQKLQEIRDQKTANQNRLVENAKKRAARSRG
jgi:hypothetical protein